MKRHLRSVPNCSAGASVSSKNADQTLEILERRAWNDYHRIAKTLAIRHPGKALAHFLDVNIVPGFFHLGFDVEFTRTLISLAAGAWESLSTAPTNVIDFHPGMRNDLEEVRQGLLIQADTKMAQDPAAIFLTPEATFEMVQRTMDPANLHNILDEITTPWIILPRAYSTLRRDQAHYLPAYLEMIASETNEEALHIFTRIAIEFLANFSIRFCDDHYAKEQGAELVVAGYKAMYWKLLRSPPKGLEDVRVFEHFLSWMTYSDMRSMGRLPNWNIS